jgi:hypothetical protein
MGFQSAISQFDKILSALILWSFYFSLGGRLPAVERINIRYFSLSLSTGGGRGEGVSHSLEEYRGILSIERPPPPRPSHLVSQERLAKVEFFKFSCIEWLSKNILLFPSQFYLYQIHKFTIWGIKFLLKSCKNIKCTLDF